MKKTLKIFIALAFVISVFCICALSASAMQIFVKTLTNDTITLEVEPNGTVELKLDKTYFTLDNADGNIDPALLTNTCIITASGGTNVGSKFYGLVPALTIKL